MRIDEDAFDIVWCYLFARLEHIRLVLECSKKF